MDADPVGTHGLTGFMKEPCPRCGGPVAFSETWTPAGADDCSDPSPRWNYAAFARCSVCPWPAIDLNEVAP